MAAKSGREARRSALLTFSHLTDMHVVDAQSPARVEFLDRYDDATPDGSLTAAYRPHEFLTAHVADTMAATVRSLGAGPVSKQPPAFAISTGDAVDNCQENELRWMIDLLDGGGTVRADSGDLSKWEGVADSDPTLLRRRTTGIRTARPPARPPTSRSSKYGFPRIPGLLDAVRRPFTATGLGIPWYAAYGNHDGLIQGNAPIDGAVLEDLHRRRRRSSACRRRSAPLAFAANLLAGKPLPEGLPARRVTADPEAQGGLPRRDDRRALHHDRHPGRPRLHRRRTAAAARRTTRSRRPIRCSGIVLDTVNPGGLSNGSLDPAQFAWLKTQLTAAAGKIVVLFSHHTIATMDNDRLAAGEKGPRILGPAGRARSCSATRRWCSGSTGTPTSTRVIAHKRPPGTGGFWELNTASHIDWPQQSRLVEIMDNHDGTLSVFGTILDFVAPDARPDEAATPRRSSRRSRGCCRPTTGRSAPATAPPSTAGAARSPTATSNCSSPTPGPTSDPASNV